MESRAQIEAVLEAVLKPAHLDWHSLRLDGRADLSEQMLRLAREHGLALRITGRSYIQRVLRQGLPANGLDFLASRMLEPVGKPARYAPMLRELPAGLSEWAVRPGIDNT